MNKLSIIILLLLIHNYSFGQEDVVKENALLISNHCNTPVDYLILMRERKCKCKRNLKKQCKFFNKVTHYDSTGQVVDFDPEIQMLNPYRILPDSSIYLSYEDLHEFMIPECMISAPKRFCLIIYRKDNTLECKRRILISETYTWKKIADKLNEIEVKCDGL